MDTALRDFCHDINQAGSIKLQYQSNNLQHAAIESNTAISVYRIVQELINNILKHAGATTALVQVNKDDAGIAITVEDDGKGFDTAFLHRSKGMGWSNIHSRVDYLNGTMDIESTPHKGTSVLIEFPV
ncbi:sensor histidine kinase [Paraflavitalea speifideaquila]|uniref:sensor histidine kinase n=1 Tax=Paraflavitalea speifideaquila TaxID=3076558 RepID=UPI0028E8FDC8|nr:ATP-binding protein [Paraflavitalea speifideiaquila]